MDAPTEAEVHEAPAAGHVHPVVDRLAGYSWRLLVIAAVGLCVVWLVGQLLLVVIPIVVATLVTVALAPIARWLRGHGLHPIAATWVAMLAFAAVIGLAGYLIVPAIVDEFDQLGETISDGIDEVEQWLVDDAPFDVEQADIDDAREQIGDALRDALGSSGGAVREGAILLGEIVAGFLLSIVLTFFFIKDGDRFQQWCLRRIPPVHHPLARRMANRSWGTLGGYLRGSATLGIIEAIIIGVAMWAAGADLIVPVMVITFAAAFVPFVGAIVAGIIAVLVTLVSGGAVPALIVGIVALVVQQLDNDLLAPFVFGSALDLHPVIVLLALTGGTALFGIVGALFAVPVTAVAINAWRAAREPDDDEPPAGVAAAVAETG